MRRLRVVYRPEAIADLEDIARFLLERGVSVAVVRRFIAQLRKRCRRVGDAPRGSVAREDLSPGLRIAPFRRRAAIAYRIIDGAVEITNVFYGGRDYEALYRHAEHAPEDPDL